jgi:signal transduction histidine kinase
LHNWLAWSGWRIYGLTLAVCGLATVLSLWLTPIIEPTPMVLFLVAVVASAWLGGLGPALVASLLSTLALYIYFLGSPAIAQVESLRGVLPLTAFLLTGTLVGTLSAARRRADQAQAQAAASEQAALATARGAQHRAGFLAEVGTLLASSLDFDLALDNLARMVVSWQLADWCLVDVFDSDGSLRRVAAVHSDPAKQPLVTELQKRYDRLAPRATHTLWKVLLPEQPWIDPEVDEARLAAEARDPEHFRLLRDIGFKSEMVVPLSARGRTLGAITMVRGDRDRPYNPDDLALAEELARRAGLAADNARLYAEAQRLNTELEQRVNERTTQLIQSHEELSRLSAHLQTAREEERARIAREIHDELGGSLTGVKMDVARLRRLGNPGSDEWLAQVETVSTALDETVQTVRRIATELRPAILDDFGLVAAIEWQLKEFQARSGIVCQLTAATEPIELDRDSATAIFRVFQETLTNVARHADATHVAVQLEPEPGWLVLRVSDNGRGIDPAALAQSSTFGLAGMRERVRMLSGQLVIQSPAGQGTTVLVKVPLPGASVIAAAATATPAIKGTL